MSVKIITNIPGPRSLDLAERRSNSVAQGHGTVCNVYIKKGEGSLLTDVDDNVFIDFAGGIGTINIGHSHPKVTEVVNNQVNNYLHTLSQRVKCGMAGLVNAEHHFNLKS